MSLQTTYGMTIKAQGAKLSKIPLHTKILQINKNFIHIKKIRWMSG